MGPAWTPAPELRPSEYTGALIQAIRARRHAVIGARALEIGSGSGVVLAALGALGARALVGVDIEDVAIESSRSLMDDLGYGAIAEILAGDMWAPVADRRFDLIVANLPHFPMAIDASPPGRRPTWSAGGPDGRRLLDPFLAGLERHLAPGGRALLTHNAFLDVDRTRALAAKAELAVRQALATFVFVPPEKLDCMTPAIRAAETGRTIHIHGPYAFAEVKVIEIAATEVLA